MNEKGHAINAFLLSVGLGYLLEWSVSAEAFITIVKVTPPIMLGALFPDLDTSFGTHRKTFHNIWILLLALAFPLFFDNLHYVWIGILTHYILDLLGNVKGMGVFYPLGGFYDIPVGVNIDSRWADVVTLAVTGFELAVIAVAIYLGYEAQLATPDPTRIIGDAIAMLPI